MDTTRARVELGWRPRFTAAEALREVLDGMRERCGIATDPLAPQGGATLEPRTPAPLALESMRIERAEHAASPAP